MSVMDCSSEKQPKRRENPSPGENTPPPSILDFWSRVTVDPACGTALANALLARPRLVDELYDYGSAMRQVRRLLGSAASETEDEQSRRALCLTLTSLVLEAAGRSRNPLRACRRSIADLEAACAVEPAAIDVVVRFLRGRDIRETHLTALVLRLRSAALAAGRRLHGQMELRTNALEAFTAGRFALAERIYRHLIEDGSFEPGSTRTHLARVLIMTGRETEAQSLVDEAWDGRAKEPPYVVGRIVYLQALLAALANGNPMPALSQLKQLAGDPQIQVDWTLMPVLRRISSRLNDEQNALFTVLLAALSGDVPFTDLDAMPLWRQLACAADAGGNQHA